MIVSVNLLLDFCTLDWLAVEKFKSIR